MKKNENIQIIGKNIILIPYEANHVEKYVSNNIVASLDRLKFNWIASVSVMIVASIHCLPPFGRYHKWMTNPELQQLTASEPLTLDEEYQMQKSWRIDENSTVTANLEKKTIYFFFINHYYRMHISHSRSITVRGQWRRNW